MGSLGYVIQTAISYHLCCLVNVGLIKLWDIRLQLLFLQHIKTNCELQQVLHCKCVTQNLLFKNTACAVTLSGTIHTHGRSYTVSCQVNLKCRGCVTQVDLHRVPPFWKSCGEGAPKWDLRLQPIGKDRASSAGTGRRFPKTPDFSSNIPDRTGRRSTCRLMLTMMHDLGCLVFEFLPSLPYTLTSRRTHAFVLWWAKHLAPSICLHSCLSVARARGWGNGEKVSTRKGAVLCQWSTLVFNSCCAEIQRDQLIAEVQILLWYNSTYTELGFKYHSFGFKYDWTNIFYLLSTTMTSASTWGKSCKEC